MEIAEAFEEINQFCTEKLKDIDYHIVAVFARRLPEGGQASNGFTFSNINGDTPFGIVRAVVGPIHAQVNKLISWYQDVEVQPLFGKQGEERQP